ncbi:MULTISPECIES: inositol monophosphatase family protein [Rhizobium]|uniref:Myo-inositol-1(Or 4)-monophosphatase n=1 Tax=Rhizobium lentis TaxID=1138194 RepID=A0A7W8UIC7_9HYPH|nr:MULTISPECIES: inositol monophosphatase family protein [Rhizobium]MBB4572895.1 myo-inositol-1(or 4)-monophosphatase [Rhizobium lentis]MBB5547916.1 myo-inositol-1(or 4)-monophosphatase [Rhizobium lentis]MBB5558443.1 myo-inositol-1(or 4)-monophosphatase [Rhizobium lentis]MBB5566033.1 myo-inositol-1(or 4)-monophosphatase [Rhizobium lentis]MEB3046628.1 inositol monophosphatase family protein [Rhizobium sp. MJ21]
MSISDKDILFLGASVREAARAEIMPRFRNLGTADVSEKTSAIDLVTEADVLAEHKITAALKERFPAALVVGEEAYDVDRSVVPALADAELAFVIDPVDGTFNFAAGLPVFGTMLAVTVRGETVAGIIHDPVLGDTVMAIKGAGSFLTRQDGQSSRLKVAEPAALDQMVGGISWGHMDDPDRSRICSNLAKIRMTFAFNCSAYEYWMVASGKLHFIGHAKLMPWDHLAGVLAHQEAGGHTAKFDGTPYRPGETTGGIISAPDRDSWQLIRREVIGI